MFQKLLLKKIFIVVILLAGFLAQTFYTQALTYKDNTQHCLKDKQINDDFLKGFNKYKHKVISAPIDLRPTSNEYLENLVNLGGDVLIGADKEYLDKGPSSPTANDWIHGDSKALRNNIMDIVGENNNANSTVIINTSSYIFGGLVGTRIPSHYMNNEVSEAILDIDLMTKKYNAPRYYVHIVVPRVIPETRGFDYKGTSYDYGLDYYYTKSIAGDLAKVKKNSFYQFINRIWLHKSKIGNE